MNRPLRIYIDYAPTLRSDMNEIIKILDLPKTIIKDNERQRRVYSVEGICPTLLGRSDSPKILQILKLKVETDN